MLLKLLYLRDQHRHLPEHLLRMRAVPLQEFDIEELHHKITQVMIPKPFDELNSRAFFNYEIFPPNILSAYADWQHRRSDGRSDGGKEMSLGDTIVQHINFPPLFNNTFRLICGVKVREVVDQNKLKQFTYETLTEHVETGRAVFSLFPQGNQTRFKIETWSSLAAWLPTFLGVPLGRYQDYCTKKAMQRAARLWS